MKSTQEKIQKEKELTKLYLMKTYQEIKEVFQRMGIDSEALEETKNLIEKL